jgi:hypothetical protein
MDTVMARKIGHYIPGINSSNSEETTGVATLPYQHCVTNKISRLLAKHNIMTIHIPARKSIHMLGSVKDKLGLKVPGIYHIP